MADQTVRTTKIMPYQRSPSDRAFSQYGIGFGSIRINALLIFIRCEPKPKKSKATSNDKSNPTHPLRHRPISDDYWPVLKNSHQVEQRHHGEDYPGHHKIC